MSQAEQSLLGKETVYCSDYDASLLFPIPRQEKRAELGISETDLPFTGLDVWTAFEVSWLNHKGLPQVRVANFQFDAASTYLIESKSFKLYLNSFNGTRFDSEAAVIATMEQDLTSACSGRVSVKLNHLDDINLISGCEGLCLDELDVSIDSYELDASLLSCALTDLAPDHTVNETLYSHLLKSNCLVTGQPDWGSIVIQYEGPKIDEQSLLKYLVSYRNHMEFHEQCVERVFSDIMANCRPSKLLVYARYVRRGGLDINPYRANYEANLDLRRWVRQ